MRHVVVATIIGVWSTLNVALNFAARLGLRHDGLNFPSAEGYTLVHMLSSGVYGLLRSDRAALLRQIKDAWRPILITGICNVAAISLNNSSLAIISVVLNQVIKACVPLPTMLLERLLLSDETKAATSTKYAAAVIVVLGAIVASASGGGDAQMTWGVFLAVASTLLTSLRTVLTARLLQRTNRMPVVHVLACDALISSMVLVPFVASGWTDIASFCSHFPETTVALLLLSSCCAVAYNQLTLELTKRMTPVTMSIVSTSRQTVLLLIATLVESGQAPLLRCVGVLQVVLGSAYYALQTRIGPKKVTASSPTNEVADALQAGKTSRYMPFDEETPTTTTVDDAPEPNDGQSIEKESIEVEDAKPPCQKPPVLTSRKKTVISLCLISGLTISAMTGIAFASEAIALRSWQDVTIPVLQFPSLTCKPWGGQFEVVFMRYSESFHHTEKIFNITQSLDAPITVYQAVDAPTLNDIKVSIRSTMRALVMAASRDRCVHLEYSPNIMDEGFAFLDFIRRRYDSLPQHMVFIKGSLDDVSDLPRGYLDDFMLRFSTGLGQQSVEVNTSVTCDFASMPTDYTPSTSQLPNMAPWNPAHSGYRQVWNRLEAAGIDPPTHLENVPELISYGIHARSTFVTSRNAITRRPRGFYEILLETLLTYPAKDFDAWFLTRHGTARQRAWGQYFLEHMWRVIFLQEEEYARYAHASCICPLLTDGACAEYTALMEFQYHCSFLHFQNRRPSHGCDFVAHRYVPD